MAGIYPSKPLSYWFRLISTQKVSLLNNPKFLKPSHSSYFPAPVEGTECFETSVLPKGKHTRVQYINIATPVTLISRGVLNKAFGNDH
jgi:hypothetical protein